MTEEYLHDVANSLGGDWANLAQSLGIPRSTIQAIRANQLPDEDQESGARQTNPGMNMFIQWHKRTSASTNKVST